MDAWPSLPASTAVPPPRGRTGEAGVIDSRIAIDGLSLRLLRDSGMATAVDAEALLRSDDPIEPPYWMHLWPGAMALARIVARAPEVRPGALVLELGSGLALPSLAAAVRGATVVATDGEQPPLRLALRSARRNGTCILAIQMSFGKPAVCRPCDVLLGAEVSYDERQVPALVDAAVCLLGRGGVAWFSDSVNAYRTTFAEALRTAGFQVRVRSLREREEGRPVWVRLIEARRP